MKKTINKLTAVMLAVTMVLTFIPILGSRTVYANGAAALDPGGGTLSIQLVDDGTVPNIKGAQVSSIWFGNYQLAPIPQSGDRSPEPVKWRVLENADKRLFLLSDQNLDCQKYNETASSTMTWADSSIRAWLNNEFRPAVFSDKEGAYCVMSSLVVNDVNPEYGDNYPAGVNTTDSVFLLSIGEATNASYGFTDNFQPTIIREAKNTEYAKAMGASTASGSIEDDCNGSWWLRTPGVRGNAAYVSYDGRVVTYGINVEAETIAVRPAFKLDLTSVLFASAATGGKVSGDVGAESLTAVPYNSSGEWKLTLKNERYYGDIGFDASAASGATLEMNEGYSDWSIPVVYSGAKTGDNEYVSVILCDSDGTAKYYGNIARNSAASSDTGQAVTIPAGLAPGHYTMYIFNEQINGDKLTDYASDFSTVELTVNPLYADPQPQPAEQKITASNVTKTYGNAAFNLNAKTNGDGALTYQSDNEKVAVVSRAGKVTIKGVGTAKITISAAATANYTAASKTITVTVNKATNPLDAKGKTATVKYKKLKKADQTLAVTKVIKFTKEVKDKKNYTLSSAKKGSKSFKKYFKVNKTTGKVTVKKGLKKGKYKVTVKVKALGNSNYKASSWKTVTFKVKIK